MARSRSALDEHQTDEELLRALAAGRQEVLGPLYARYARLIFSLASQSLDRAAAEEIVQDVFLGVWRKAESFDPRQGAVRPWILQLAHWRILNELRRQARRPRTEPQTDADADTDTDPLGSLADTEPDPAERAWRDERRETLRAALNSLPPAQRQAVSLAFVDELTHAEVAQRLGLPLGTAKTRIRTGLGRLHVQLAPVAASLLALALAVVGIQDLQRAREQQMDEDAIRLVTTSEIVPLRLVPVSSAVPAQAHAVYRGRTGAALAVLTTEDLPQLPNGQVYQAWVRHGDQWTSLGVAHPDATGNTFVIARGQELAQPPEAAEITIESGNGSASPSGTVVLAWSP